MQDFESQFNPIRAQQSGLESKREDFEVLKTPEISIHEEYGAQLLSFLLKARDREWGSNDTQLSAEVEDYFSHNPLNPAIADFFKEIQFQEGSGVDQEVLYILALTYKHEERYAGAFEVIAKHKSYITNAEQLQEKLFRILEIGDELLQVSPIGEKLDSEIERDKKAREEIMAETRGRIENLIAIFKPDSETTKVQRISLMPTDPFEKSTSGNAFIFGEELVLKTHIDNHDNLEHEFLHCVINPIVEKLSGHLSDEQKDKISQQGSGKLKLDYGTNYYSLLCEEFIRKYLDVFVRGEKPYTYEKFAQMISGINEERFQKFMERKSLREMCAELEIETLEDFKSRSREYYERFEQNHLRDLIYSMYQDYSRRANPETENFETFVLREFPTKI